MSQQQGFNSQQWKEDYKYPGIFEAYSNNNEKKTLEEQEKFCKIDITIENMIISINT